MDEETTLCGLRRLRPKSPCLMSPGKHALPHEYAWQQNHCCHPSFAEKLISLPANARFLERPQGVQRSLLRCGETPDARDIESFVGSIPPQRLELLATVQIPEHNGSTIPAARQSAAIKTHLERLHRPLMRLLHPYALSALDLPPAHRPYQCCH